MSVDAQFIVVDVAAVDAGGESVGTGSEATYVVSPSGAVSSPSSSVASRGAAERASFLGQGLLWPFRRSQSDFATASGVALVKSAVAQIVGTRADTGRTAGELPWRTDFGSWLHLLRYTNQDVLFEDVAVVYVGDAVRRWEPRARVKAVELLESADAQSTQAILRIVFDVVTENAPNNAVVASSQVADVPLAA